jgi:hypothetical protein
MRRIDPSIERRQAVMNGFVWIASRSSSAALTADPPPPSAILFILQQHFFRSLIFLVELVCSLLRLCYLNTTEQQQQQQDLPYDAALQPSPCRPRLDLLEPSVGVWGTR